MTRVRLNETVLQRVPDLLKGADAATVQVNLRNAGIATVYQDETTGATWTNPLITRAGLIEPVERPGGIVWLEPGSYDLLVDLGTQTYTTTFEAVVGGDAADVSNVLDGSAWDNGDSVDEGGGNTSGQLINMAQGTAAVPDTVSDPVFKVSRTASFADTAEVGAQPSIYGAVADDANNRSALMGVLGFAEGFGNSRTPSSPDPVGVAGKVRMRPGSAGAGFGGWFFARKEAGATGGIACISTSLQNNSGVDGLHGDYNSTGLVLIPQGTNTSSNGITLYNNSGNRFDVGIGFLAPNGGPTVRAAIVDDGDNVTSYEINGAHTNGINMQGGTFTGNAILLDRGAANTGINFDGPTLYASAGNMLNVTHAFTSAQQIVGTRFIASAGGGSGYLEMSEQSADPAAPAVNTGRLFFKDNGSGKTQLAVIFPTGAPVVIATQP